MSKDPMDFLKGLGVDAPVGAAKTYGPTVVDKFKASADKQISYARGEMEGNAPDPKFVYYRKDMGRGGYSVKLARKPLEVHGKMWFDGGPDLESVIAFFEKMKDVVEKSPELQKALEENSRRERKAA